MDTKKPVPVRIPPEMVARLDALRGLAPREAYVRHLLDRALKAEERKAKRMSDNDLMMTDDAKLISALLQSDRPESARSVAEMAGVDEDYAKEALARMADWPHPASYSIFRRPDLGPDVYEAAEDWARSWRRRPDEGAS